ncbi:MAG TPA: dihydrofolate reductase family protein [Anaerolineales bacterium]|nr:dihydrofolate reductase family protein [Anaerolineales bacterium]
MTKFYLETYGNLWSAISKRRIAMRRVVVLEHISLDGVIQAPGGPDEDPSGGFAYGGWIAPYSDADLGTILNRQMDKPFDLLLGRKTFAIWAPYWPQHAEAWPGVNTATKYVASNTMTTHEWQPSVFLNGDIAEKIAKIKQQQGPDLHVWGSSDLVQTLMKHDLVDAFWLMIYPLTLGGGKRLFATGTIPSTFKVTESKVSSTGVVVLNYERVGAVTAGNKGA